MPPEALEAFQAAVRAEMARALEERDLPFYTMLRYHLGWTDGEGRPVDGGGGKGLRATLCLLCAQALGARVARVLPAAAALELVHNFSLIHDDIQDASPERRHRPTVWKIWGEAQAINAGDSMFALAHLALSRLAETGVDAPAVLEAYRILDRACVRLCEGQYLDLEYQGRPEITSSEYLDMIGGKTAALFEASCRLGTLLGGGTPEVVERFGSAGRHLGFAFQVRDDVLGVWGDAASLGKPVAEDVRTGKKALPAVLAFERAGARERGALAGLYARVPMNDGEVERVLQLFEQLEVREEAQRRAAEYAAAARREVEAAGVRDDAVEQILELVRFSVEREF